MESSSPSGNTSEPPNGRWSEILGTMIAILTLTLPLLVINYSSSTVEPLPRTVYSIPRSQN